MEKKICCICGKEITGWGNNPDGAVWVDDGKIQEPTFGPDDYCCDECNVKYVIPGRLYKLNQINKVEKD